MERIKRIVHQESRKKAPRTIVDILGTEDFEAFKDEIDLEMKKAQLELQQMQGQMNQKPKKSKRSVYKGNNNSN